MGLMDRVKAQATVLAQRAEETARDSKARYDQVQARRRADAQLRDLGTAVYAERTGRSTGDTDAKIDRLVADLAAYESDSGVDLTAPRSAQPPWGAASSGGGGDGYPAADGGPDDGGTTQV